jgi:hypothetical protein
MIKTEVDMVKRIEFLTPNRAKFESEFKTFNKAVDLITTGNVVGNVQYSNYITQQWNLIKAFPGYYLRCLPDFIKIDINNRVLNGEKVILYCLKLKQRPVAWILTDNNHNLLIKCRAGLHQYAKETSVLNEALQYLTN